MEKKDSFVFYRSFYESFKEIEEKGVKVEIIEAICEYCLNGEKIEFQSDVAKALFIAIKPTLDKAINRYKASVENGKKGGRPKKNKNLEKPNNNLYVDVDVDDDVDINNNISCPNELDELPNNKNLNGNQSKEKEKKEMIMKVDEENFNVIWNEYPRKEAKTQSFKYYTKFIHGGRTINGKKVKLTADQILDAVMKYAEEVKGKDKEYIKIGSTFFNLAILDYVEGG